MIVPTASGAKFVSAVLTALPVSAPLPVPFEATYRVGPAAPPILIPQQEPVVESLAIGSVEAAAEYGATLNTSQITLVTLRRTGAFGALLVDGVELTGGTSPCSDAPESSVEDSSPAITTFLGNAAPLVSSSFTGRSRPVSVLIGG